MGYRNHIAKSRKPACFHSDGEAQLPSFWNVKNAMHFLVKKRVSSPLQTLLSTDMKIRQEMLPHRMAGLTCLDQSLLCLVRSWEQE